MSESAIDRLEFILSIEPKNGSMMTQELAALYEIKSFAFGQYLGVLKEMALIDTNLAFRLYYRVNSGIIWKLGDSPEEQVDKLVEMFKRDTRISATPDSSFLLQRLKNQESENQE